MTRSVQSRLAAFLALALAAAGLAPNRAAAQEAPGVYIIYDSSNSMWGALPDGSRKYEAARAAMRELAGQDFAGRSVALRMYGHRRKDDCSDSALVVPFSPAEAAVPAMIEAMEQVRPTGRTPIDLSLRQALEDFGSRPGTIVLVSDGIESCDADPCALVRAWRDRDVQITVHVVGLGLTGREKAAMECIAEAAGTAYRDAFSASELVDGIGTALAAATPGESPEAGTPAPEPDEAGPDFALVVETGDGVRRRGAGVLVAADGTEIPVESFRRHTPVPGDYTLVAGLVTVGGEIYRPVTQPVTVADNGRTVARVIAPEPPRVTASFAMEGAALRATVVLVYRDGEKLGSFKGDEAAYVPEGTLEFRSQLAGTSAPLTVTESFAAGDAKQIAFDAATEVHLTVMANASSTGERLRGKPSIELWQNGQVAHTVNNSSGGLVAPGAYTLVIDDGLNRFETPIEVGTAPDQELALSVPAGAVTVDYRDASGAAEPPKRVFFTRADGGRRVLRQSGEPVALVPGRYTVQGWPRDAGYPPAEVEIAAGQQHTVTLRAAP